MGASRWGEVSRRRRYAARIGRSRAGRQHRTRACCAATRWL